MERQAVQTPFAHATRQEDRWPAALDPEFAKADDRSLFELIAFGSRFSQLIAYYALDSTPDGDWAEFFTRDPLLTMASIAATDIRGAGRGIARLEQRARAASPAGRPARVKALLEAALELPRQINRWLAGLNSPFSHDVSTPLRHILESSVRQSLRVPLRRLVHGNPFDLQYREFTGTWQLEEEDPRQSIYTGRSIHEQVDAALPLIAPLWQAFPDAIAGWAELSRPELAKAFDGTGAHQPHVALFVAFARLFSVAQSSLNAVASRRTDFYYGRILRERRRPAVAETVHVAFTAASEREPAAIVVPSGTLLSAGKDAQGQEVVFASQDEVRVTSASLRRMLTLRVASGPLAIGIDQIVTQRVLARDVSAVAIRDEGWPTFGSLHDLPADIGFAVSSPVLELADGERTIALVFRYDLADGGTAPLTALEAATGLTRPVLLQQMLEHAFTLTISSAAGWIPIASYAVDLSPESGEPMFGLRFTLSADAPAVTSLEGSGMASPIPAVRAILRQTRVPVAGPRGSVAVYPLSVLEGVTIRSATAHVDVVGTRPTQISTVSGEMDQSRPFPAFGAIPVVRSTLRIRHSELFAKTVTRLACHIAWHDLPTHDTGFRGYFRGYVIDQDGNVRHDLFDNQVFRVAVAAERPGSWTIAGAAGDQSGYLFRTVAQVGAIPDQDGRLAARTSLDDLEIEPLAPPSSSYDPADGCIRVELTGPDYAFGQTLYQQNMMHAAMAPTPNAGACDATCRSRYRVLAETRRQLDVLLKDLRRRRPLAGVAHVASPRFWAGLPMRGLNAAYLGVTRLLPAYAARRPDPSPRSASAISVQYADDEVAEPASLPLLDNRESRRIVAARFDVACDALLNEARACLSSCLAERSEQMSLAEWRRLRQKLADAAGLHAADRLASLRELHERLERGKDFDRDDQAAELLFRCHTMLQAASWVSDCTSVGIDTAGWGYWRSICANLVTCTSSLEKLHESAIERCTQMCMLPRVRPLPAPPYVPQIEALTIDYAASGSAALAHLLPYEGFSQASTRPSTLLPRWAGRGILYLGFSEGAPTAALPLYVRLGQRPHDDGRSPRPSWDALVGHQWIALDTTAAGSDATLGLQRSGIVTLPMPAGESGASTVLPPGLRWLRASVAEEPDSFPKVMAVLPHATTAVRHIAAGSVGDSGRAVPAGSIRSLVKPIRGLGPVVQPSPSYGGRAAESERALQTRISERLRHKDRTIVGWDYERCVLERFPEIAMVRAIPARRAGAAGGGPGHVRIVIVPGRDYPNVTDPTAPTASGDTLDAIARMLKGTSGPFVVVHVMNPVFVRLKVNALVRWRDAEDASAAAERLNAALMQFLSPWSSGATLAGRTSADVEGFMRSYPDVESIDAIAISYDRDVATEAEPERCVLTSALRHDIRSVAAVAVVAAAGY